MPIFKVFWTILLVANSEKKLIFVSFEKNIPCKPTIFWRSTWGLPADDRF